jgi:alpha-glucosidase
MKIVGGKIGEYIIVARRLGDDWYIAGQTNWNQRKADFTLDFIENPNEYEVEYIIDGLNADKDARDYVIKREGQIKTNWSIHMASGGGFAMKIIKKH